MRKFASIIIIFVYLSFSTSKTELYSQPADFNDITLKQTELRKNIKDILERNGQDVTNLESNVNILKEELKEKGIRVVPHAVARYGSYISEGVILMPSYVNIGAYVDKGTMVDTWATVGSCAQIGKNVHLSGGVGIGGVLEPLQAAPVIIEDNAFIGSRCIVVEGVRVEKEAVLGANVVLTSSTKIIDVTGSEPVETRGIIPARSVVIPGSYTKNSRQVISRFRVL
jgi:Tetrahydrodipicolinate N-succinyltransferase